MRKLYIILTKLICFFISISYLTSILSFPRNRCDLHTKRIYSIHDKLKKLVHNEMLRIPDNIDNKEKLRGIWYEGGHRNKIRRIVSKNDALTKRDLLDLKFYIIQEKKLLPQKIKRIVDIVNHNLLTKIFETLKFKKSEQEIEELYKEVEVSADELLKQEHKTYDTIINKINDINNLNAHK